MVRRVFVALCTVALATAAFAHGDDTPTGATLPRGERESHSTTWRDWFKAPKYNETETDVAMEQEQLAIQRTSASMSGDASTVTAIARQEDQLEIRARIARWRTERDAARNKGDKTRAAKLDRRIHAAKKELETPAER
jgi:hypothetical protein